MNNPTHPDEKSFALYTILAVTHRLPSHLQPYLELLEYLTGAALSPAQWPRARQQCANWLLELHPQLRRIPAPPNFGGDERAMDTWAAHQHPIAGGATLPVTPLPVGWRLRTGPIDELLDLVDDPNKVILIDPTKPDLGLRRPDEPGPSS